MPIARDLARLGFKLIATRGTANFLRAHGLEVEIVFKVNEGRPHVGDEILNQHIQLVINTPLGRESFFDDRTVRRIATMQSVPCITTLTGAAATVNAIRALAERGADRARAPGIPRTNCDGAGLSGAQFLPARFPRDCRNPREKQSNGLDSGPRPLFAALRPRVRACGNGGAASPRGSADRARHLG